MPLATLLTPSTTRFIRPAPSPPSVMHLSAVWLCRTVGEPERPAPHRITPADMVIWLKLIEALSGSMTMPPPCAAAIPMAVVRVVVLVAATAPIAPWSSAHITRARWLSSAVATVAPVGVT